MTESAKWGQFSEKTLKDAKGKVKKKTDRVAPLLQTHHELTPPIW